MGDTGKCEAHSLKVIGWNASKCTAYDKYHIGQTRREVSIRIHELTLASRRCDSVSFIFVLECHEGHKFNVHEVDVLDRGINNVLED